MAREQDFLRHHRETVLGKQWLTREDLVNTILDDSARLDLAGMITYAIFVVLYAASGSAPFLPHTIVLGAVWISWRCLAARRRKLRRDRVYEGVLKQKIVENGKTVGVFVGGRVVLRQELAEALVPGIRYRVHVEGQDAVVVDVATNEAVASRSAYR